MNDHDGWGDFALVLRRTVMRSEPMRPVDVAHAAQLVDEALAEVLEVAGIPRPQPTRELAQRSTHNVIGPTGIFGVEITQGKRSGRLAPPILHSTSPWITADEWFRSVSQQGLDPYDPPTWRRSGAPALDDRSAL